MRRLNIQVAAATVLLVTVTATAQQPKQPARDAESCARSALLSELMRKPDAEILRSYGYDLGKPWTCVKLRAPSTNLVVLRFRNISAGTDDLTMFSVMNVSGSPYLWVVPNYNGMTAPGHVESDPHNIAAFNALLRSLPKKPSNSDDWRELGLLYMAFVVGEDKPISLQEDSSRVSSDDAAQSRVVTFADRAPQANEAYVKWTISFRVSDNSHPPRLVEVEREVVQPLSEQHDQP